MRKREEKVTRRASPQHYALCVKLVFTTVASTIDNLMRFAITRAYEREPSASSEAFHFELTTMFLQPSPLSRVFFWNQLLLLLARGNLVIVETTDESEGVAGG